MAMSINKIAGTNDKSLYYDQTFRRHLESYMGWFRNHPETTTLPVNPHNNYKYEGDLYGLLLVNGVPKEYHWVVMRMNNIYRQGDVEKVDGVVLIPDFGVLDRIMKMYKTRTKKNLT